MNINGGVMTGRGSNISSGSTVINDRYGGGAVIVTNRVVADIFVTVTSWDICSAMIGKMNEEVVLKDFTELMINELLAVYFFDREGCNSIDNTDNII